jgi:hypothetical protein
MNPEHKEYFMRMLEIIDLPEYNNAMIASQYIVDAIKDLKLSLSGIEATLRFLNSRVHLIGLPLSYYNSSGTEYISKSIVNNERYEHVLWIELNGHEALIKLLKDLNLGDSDVDRSLEKTGFLMITK